MVGDAYRQLFSVVLDVQNSFIMKWSNELPPGQYSMYDHVLADTPLGEAKIEWKSWKSNPDYGVEVGHEYIGTEYSLEDAKLAVGRYLMKVYNELSSFCL